MLIELSAIDLSLAAFLVLMLGILSTLMKLGISR